MLKKILKKEVKDYKAKDVMTKNVIALRPSQSMLEVVNRMSQYKIKRIVVAENDIAVV